MLNQALLEVARVIGWVIGSALLLGLGMGLTVKMFDITTPGLNEIEELKKGNIAVAIVLAAVILAVGFVVGLVLAEPF